ncbi:hypothetical protein B0O99DRAFT_600739 [Bisporella sp. PMI_857]|nr:hypothetical protein B0O99DRAFT_600739 [Bisporella sp. PMI_857]
MSENSEAGPSNRAAKPTGVRSREGCLTCKIRRVKCDERKPGCLRCEKFGRVCDGYEAKRSPTPAPSSKAVSRPVRLLPSGLIQIAPSRMPPNIKFQEPHQEQYFRLFCDETSRACAGGWEHPLWEDIILRACHEEPCILQCAVAIAALDKSCKTKDVSSNYEAAEEHHRYALQQYGKALQGLQEVTMRGNSTRMALIASLLIYCFENFHGDAQLALTHIQSALALMSDWLASTPRVTGATGFSPAPTEIEDDLVATFTRLDITVSTFMGGNSPTGSLIQHVAATDSPLIPPIFTDIYEAEKRWQHILNRIFLFTGTVVEVLRLPQSARNEIFDLNGVQHKNAPILDEIYTWQRAFESILLHSRTPEGDHLFIRATILRIISTTLTISVRMAFFDRTKTHQCDMFLPEFCEIVALASSIVSHAGFVRAFVFENGIMPALFIVAALCRDNVVRVEAVNVLRAMQPRREGVWDSVNVTKMGEELLNGEGGNINDLSIIFGSRVAHNAPFFIL